MASEQILRLQTGRIASTDEGRLLDRLRSDIAPASGALLGLGALAVAVREDARGPVVLAATAWRDRHALDDAVASGGLATPFGPASDLVSFDEAAEFVLVVGAAQPIGTLEGAAIALVRATITAGDEPAVLELIRRQHEVLLADGLARALLVGRRERPDGVEIAAVGVWPDREATATFLATRPEGPGLDARFSSLASALRFEMFDALDPSGVLPPSRVPAILVLDRDREIVDGSPGIERMIGIPVETLVGRHLDQLVAPEELARLPGRWRRLLEMGRETTTVVTRRGDGVVPLTHRIVAGLPTPGLCSLLLTEPTTDRGEPPDALVRRALRDWHPPTRTRAAPRPRLVSVPSADALFAGYVAATLDRFGAPTVRRLQLHLRGLHPDAVVHRRTLAAERGETWYVYRDGGARPAPLAERWWNSADTPSIEIDDTGRIVAANEEAARLLGTEPGSLAGRALEAFAVDGTQEDLSLLLRIAFAMMTVDSRIRLERVDGATVDLAIHGEHDDGRLHLGLSPVAREAHATTWFAPLCLPPSDGGFIADVESLLERLAPREASELAAELEVRLRVRYPVATVRSLGRVTGFGEGTEVLLVNRDGEPDMRDEWWVEPDVARLRISGDRYVEANVEAAELHGLARDELLASSVGRFRISGDDRLVIRDILLRTGSVHTTTTLLRADGRRVPIEFRAVLVARDPLIIEMALRPATTGGGKLQNATSGVTAAETV